MTMSIEIYNWLYRFMIKDIGICVRRKNLREIVILGKNFHGKFPRANYAYYNPPNLSVY